MKKVFFYFIIIFSYSIAYSKNILLFDSLNMVLEKRQYYDRLKELRIDSLKKLNNHATSMTEQYFLLRALHQEYKSYISDSSLAYATRGYKIACKLHNKVLKNEAIINSIFSFISMGLYDNAINMKYQIDKSMLPDSLLALWYHSQQQLYHSLALSSNESIYQKYYTTQDHLYGDSLKNIYKSTSMISQYNKAKQLILKKQYSKAKDILHFLIQKRNELSFDDSVAPLYFTLADVYYKMNNEKKYEEYLIKAAITDIQSSTKENAALYTLSIYLYKKNDIKNAYKYIMYSLDDAVFCNAQLRTARIYKMLPIIIKGYKIREEQNRKVIFIFLLSSCVISFFLIIAVFFIYRQMKKYSEAKIKLSQSNLLKEKYIKHFLSLCSVYIDKLCAFRQLVNRKLIAGQTEELLKLTKSYKLAENEQNEFYHYFDSAFLHMYPNFIEEFNKLLIPEARFVSKNNDSLNNELRIFALIYLGINDSAQIASFLHYSINTIYTYRNKVKNKAINRIEFESQLLSIKKI